MKKALALMLALLLLCAAAVAEGAPDFIGAWYMTATELGGTWLKPGELGMNVTLTLNADGTGDMTNVGVQTLAGTWTQDEDGVITLANGDTVIAKYQLKDDVMTLIESSVSMKFAREPLAEGPVTLVPVVAEKPEDFYGIYTLAFMYDENKYMTAEAMGIEAVFMVTEEGLVSMDEKGQPEVTPYLFSKVTGKLAATDGTYVMTVTLNENGSISVEQTGMMTLCLVPVE